MKRIATYVAAMAALAGAGRLHAHHSSSTIDVTTPVWVKGTVVQYEPINPHAMIELDVRGAGGNTQRWTVQGPAPGRLERYHLAKDFLKAGDVIEACGFVPKPQPERSWPAGVPLSPLASKPLVDGINTELAPAALSARRKRGEGVR